MSPVPKRLRKEPLIEVIWQIQFEPVNGLPVGDLLPGVLFTSLNKDYPGLTLSKLPIADLPTEITQNDPNLQFAVKFRLSAPQSPFLFQIGNRVITMNCQKPYVGWAQFKERILKLIEIVEGCALIPQPCRHSLRYFDLLTLDPPPDLSALRLELKLGDSSIHKLPLQLRLDIPGNGCAHIVQIATPAKVSLPNGGKQAGSLIDLETYIAEIPDRWSSVKQQVDTLHHQSKEFFFERLLTAETIIKLEPEYE